MAEDPDTAGFNIEPESMDDFIDDSDDTFNALDGPVSFDDDDMFAGLGVDDKDDVEDLMDSLASDDLAVADVNPEVDCFFADLEGTTAEVEMSEPPKPKPAAAPSKIKAARTKPPKAAPEFAQLTSFTQEQLVNLDKVFYEVLEEFDKLAPLILRIWDNLIKIAVIDFKKHKGRKGAELQATLKPFQAKPETERNISDFINVIHQIHQLLEVSISEKALSNNQVDAKFNERVKHNILHYKHLTETVGHFIDYLFKRSLGEFQDKHEVNKAFKSITKYLEQLEKMLQRILLSEQGKSKRKAERTDQFAFIAVYLYLINAVIKKLKILELQKQTGKDETAQWEKVHQQINQLKSQLEGKEDDFEQEYGITSTEVSNVLKSLKVLKESSKKIKAEYLEAISMVAPTIESKKAAFDKNRPDTEQEYRKGLLKLREEVKNEVTKGNQLFRKAQQEKERYLIHSQSLLDLRTAMEGFQIIQNNPEQKERIEFKKFLHGFFRHPETYNVEEVHSVAEELLVQLEPEDFQGFSLLCRTLPEDRVISMGEGVVLETMFAYESHLKSIQHTTVNSSKSDVLKEHQNKIKRAEEKFKQLEPILKITREAYADSMHYGRLMEAWKGDATGLVPCLSAAGCRKMSRGLTPQNVMNFALHLKEHGNKDIKLKPNEAIRGEIPVQKELLRLTKGYFNHLTHRLEAPETSKVSKTTLHQLLTELRPSLGVVAAYIEAAELKKYI